MADVDISAEAVERRIRELQEAGFDNAAATLHALRAERDTLAAANATLAEEIEEITAIADRGVVLHGEAAEIMSSLEAQRDAATAERDRLAEALDRFLNDAEPCRDFGEWFEACCKKASAALDSINKEPTDGE